MRSHLPLAAVLALAACGRAPVEEGSREQATSMREGTFGDDLAFLREHTDVIVLEAGDARVAVVPAYQGRVMTSTSGGPDGPSYGWLNREAIASGARQPHINVFGGEDRFWLGPEGGQFSIFFAEGDPFDLEHWQTPEPIDWGGWEVEETGETHARFTRSMELVNYSGTTLALDATRTVRLLRDPLDRLGLELEPMPGTRAVGFETDNRITNRGDAAWTHETGLLSIWILGMFNPTPDTTVVLPYVPGPEETLGPVVNDAYFGRVPPEHLVVEGDAVFFRGDGTRRGKIGLSRARALPRIGSYDAAGGVLTIVHYTLLDDATDYVNSMWEIQDEPFSGDVVNSYNDGPPEPGAPPLGPFYELETSSSAAALAPGESLTHVHRTFHFQGPEEELDRLAQRALGVSLEQIASAFAP